MLWADMGTVLRFPTRPTQGVHVSHRGPKVWIVDVFSPSPNNSVQRRFHSQREAVAYAQGFCDRSGFILLPDHPHSHLPAQGDTA